MTAAYNLFTKKGIRLGSLLNLIFFVLTLVGCQQNAQEQVSVFWEKGQAKGIVIPKSFLADTKEDNLKTALQIRLDDSDVPMLGNYQVVVNDDVLFKPIIPLTPGKTYKVFFKKTVIGTLTIPAPNVSASPEVLAIYPSGDTVPENLLKIYLQFSLPMREGEALQHIHLLDAKGDTVENTFLDLQPELWNKERIVLTVWLDPGRIKRDLIPNQRLGNPLQRGNSYRIVIDDKWKDAMGLSLKQSYTKKFVAGERDSETVQPEHWLIDLPSAETTQPLLIHFEEPLDYFLLLETIQVVSEKGDLLKGNIQIIDKETGIGFVPEISWKPGKYRLRIASYLEDLAGNNLNRPFDRDTKLQKNKEGDFIEREFVIESNAKF